MFFNFSPEGAKGSSVSYTRLNYHIVFCTKDRRPFILPEVMPRLAEYIGGIIRETEGSMIAANGTEDHIHIATLVSPKLALSDFVRTIKTNSSKWIHQTFPEMLAFAWQDGYSAFTVSHSALAEVAAYIRRQREHHAGMTFQEELRRLLQKHEIECDERYIWA
jgi:putative transposase